MKPYAYHVFHVPTGLHYYGIQFNQKCDPNDLWSKYYTSSKRVHNLIEEYGADSFKVEVRKSFETPEQAIEWEKKFLTKINAKNNPRWLNTHNGDFQYVNMGGYKLTEEQRTRRKGKTPWNKGKRMPPEAIARGAEKRKGRPAWNRGVSRPEHLRQRQSELSAGKNNPMYGKSAVKGRKWYTNGKDNFYVYSSEASDEWREGRTFFHKRKSGHKLTTEHRGKLSQARYGRKWFNNGIENVFVYPEEIPEGFLPGRLPFKKN